MQVAPAKRPGARRSSRQENLWILAKHVRIIAEVAEPPGMIGGSSLGRTRGPLSPSGDLQVGTAMGLAGARTPAGSLAELHGPA